MNLLKNTKLTVVSAGATAAQTAVDSTIIDMSGFDGVMFVAVLGTVTAGSVLALAAQQNAANQTSGMAAITNASAGATDSGGASTGMAIIVDVYRPLQRYLRAELTRTTANAVVQSIIAIQYMGQKKPSVQDVATVLASVQALGS